MYQYNILARLYQFRVQFFVIVLFVLVVLVWARLFKKAYNLKLRRFKSDRDEIWQDVSSSSTKYATIDGDGFSI